MTTLYYTTVHTDRFIALIVVDMQGTLYYASLGKSATELKQLVYKDFNAVKGYNLSLLVERKDDKKEGKEINNGKGAVNTEKEGDLCTSELVNLEGEKFKKSSEKCEDSGEASTVSSTEEATKKFKYSRKVDETITKFQIIMEDALRIDSIDINYKIIFGTSLQRKVWQHLLTIKLGELSTYSKIAEIMQIPTSARVVGNCVGANRIALAIPCHRVVTKAGKISGYRYGVGIKDKLLKDERLNKFKEL